MATITIYNLAQSRDLDRKAMYAICGGNSWLRGLGPVANVNVGINQNITQFQNVEVNALNNVGVIGAGFGPLSFAVNPTQFAQAAAVI
ncbi:hypothetical protein [Janthinobacterium sp. 17J80-10]|uniref:hypothetical protein n=1 Tax=Janthinobacterium sp. 17J80-10 TaxID=2497863 RepID=UPI001005649A|nr:hypothetical protein [Janthinobacterium sp. 17J80-10]QAU34947.1 hypothetical protein EKL02_12565 [Janthinobacterium sp. 17J80-10]